MGDLPVPGGDPNSWGTKLNTFLTDIPVGSITGALEAWVPTTGAVANMRSGVVNVLDYGAAGDGDAILAAVADALPGSSIEIAPATWTLTQPIVLTDGVRLIGRGAVDRWRSTVQPTIINYTGTGACIQVEPSASAGRDSIELHNIQLDGRNAGSGVDGMLLDASATNAYIEGVLLRNCAITNFGQHQIHATGTVFDVTLDRVTLHDKNRDGGNLVQTDDPVSQWRFQDSWLLNYADGTWAVYSDDVAEFAFLGGTVAPMGAGNGVYCNGSLGIHGTHFEGPSSASATTIGVRYVGSTGAFISPTSISHFGIGVQIGDGTSAQARGWVLSGGIGFNNDSVGGCDVEITDGGHRYGTILDLGYAGGEPTIRNDRFTVDAVQDVLNLAAAHTVRGNVYSATNVTTDRTFDADSTSTAELADVLGTLLADLRTYGLVR